MTTAVPEIPEPGTPGNIMVCFQIVTQGGAVVDTAPEEWASIQAATDRAHDWPQPELRGRALKFVTFEGDGAVIKTDSIEAVAVMRAEKMRDIYLEAEALQKQADMASKEGTT